MNKRQKKKQWKKNTPEEFQYCGNCGKKLNPFNSYHLKYGTCDAYCYAEMVGVSLYG